MDHIIRFLKWFQFLCYPRKNFTTRELDILCQVYADSPVPALAFANFRRERLSDIHIQELLLVMQGHPDWKLPQHARDILNGTFQWRRAIGYGMYKALTVGTDCTCCAGWRAVALMLMSIAAGYALHALQLLWG